MGIALGTSPVADCEASDLNGDGVVMIDELLQVVNSAIGAVVVNGTCLQPGPQGLMPCLDGTTVKVMRCEDQTACQGKNAGAGENAESKSVLGGGCSVRRREESCAANKERASGPGAPVPTLPSIKFVGVRAGG